MSCFRRLQIPTPCPTSVVSIFPFCILQGADVTPPAKKPRHHVLDLCGSQVKTYEEEAPTQRELYQMYIDGSHRQHWPKQIQMSAGGFCLHPAGSWFNFSCLLLGGKPTSTRAELGAIYIGCQRLINAVEGGRMNTAGSEVHMHTDCQSAANVLKRLNAKVAPKLAPLIKGKRHGSPQFLSNNHSPNY